jgi:hypothetical protein
MGSALPTPSTPEADQASVNPAVATQPDSRGRMIYLRLVQAIQCVAALAGFAYGFGIGQQIGGVFVAVIMATSSAVFGWLMTSMLADWARPKRAP